MSPQDLEQLADLVAERIAAGPILVDTRTAAAQLGMGVDVFKRDVAPFVKCIRRGTGGPGQGRATRLYLVEDLRCWANANATRVADDLRVAA